MKKHKRARASKSGIGAFAFGVLLSLLSLILLSLIAAIFLTGVKSPTKNLGAVSLAVLLISAFISGFVNSKRCGEGGVGYSVITALAFSLIMLAVSLVATRGKVGGMLFMNCLCYMMAAAFAAFLGKKRQRRRR